MEKILVVSDTHGSTYVLKALLEAPPEGLCAVFHLGDGSEESRRLMEKYPMYAYIGVKGNCDTGDTVSRDTVMTERGGVRFMLTHGHMYGVKASLMNAVVKAMEGGADVLLYGHTHIADDETFETSFGCVRAVNPGSARSAEYAVVTVDNGNVSVELMRYFANTRE
ncbi:MAG: metallophosphoesterase [Ruminococcaceae bacterium]|nr:metallophosphoesterase [Oscillospiraceae bacterium]